MCSFSGASACTSELAGCYCNLERRSASAAMTRSCGRMPLSLHRLSHRKGFDQRSVVMLYVADLRIDRVRRHGLGAIQLEHL